MQNPFRKAQQNIEKKVFGDTLENIDAKNDEYWENWTPENLISFKGKNISIVKFDDLEEWKDLDDLVSMGYEILSAPGHGMYGNYSYIILKNPPSTLKP